MRYKWYIISDLYMNGPSRGPLAFTSFYDQMTNDEDIPVWNNVAQAVDDLICGYWVTADDTSKAHMTRAVHTQDITQPIIKFPFSYYLVREDSPWWNCDTFYLNGPADSHYRSMSGTKGFNAMYDSIKHLLPEK